MGKYFDSLKDCKDAGRIFMLIEKREYEEAYRVANEVGGNQLPRELTLYLLKEYGVFPVEPLTKMEYVPENYLYEGYAEDVVCVLHSGIREIRAHAFRYAKIKRLVISASVEHIGKSALCLNGGEIVYEGSKQEFISKFFGKSMCFYQTRGQKVICEDGEIEISC